MKRFGIENNEGVSEAIGFILIFGLVLTGIALITLYGYPMLMQQQSNADVRNMEQTMVVLQNDMKALCFKNVPYKETALQVSGGSLAMVNASGTGPRLNITADGMSPVEFSPGMLVYTSDGQDATIALENGAVIRAQAGGSAMIAEPRWFFDTSSGTMVINLIALNGSPMSATGMGSVRLKLNSSSTLGDGSPSDGKVTVNITDPIFSKAWENYLTGQELEMTGSGGTYTKSGVDRLIIKKYEIQVLSI
ncbi:DUF7289 family protein [Methanofollis ethanolicus]|uniref:DUF7289 family protein n=1 Tax=Methanofollis ethanolicus TaxID=488124 RepID=UPI00083156B7|nr:hypothetical protein [Methanofollis ethanolicus]